MTRKWIIISAGNANKAMEITNMDLANSALVTAYFVQVHRLHNAHSVKECIT